MQLELRSGKIVTCTRLLAVKQMNAHRDDENNEQKSDELNARLNVGMSYGEPSTQQDAQLAAEQNAATAAEAPGELLTYREKMLYPWLAPAKKITAAKVIILANVLVFAAMAVFSGGKSAVSPTTLFLLDWGANYGPSTFGGEYWRLVSCTFVHSGFLHIAMNMAVFNDISRTVERLMGTLKFVLMYFISGIGGSLVSSLVNPVGVSVGASGAVFGVYGALLAFVQMHRSEIPKEVFSETCKGLFAFIILNLAIGFASAHTDNGAHIGGLIFGYLSGLALFNRAQLNFPVLRQIRLKNVLGTILVIGLLFGLFKVDEIGIFDKDGELVKGKISKLFDTGHLSDGFDLINSFILCQPNNPVGYSQRALMYVSLQQMDKAVPDVEKALALDPNNLTATMIKAGIFESRGDLKSALTLENNAVRIAPSKPQPYAQRATTNRNLRRYREALSDCDMAMKLSSKSTDLILLKASILEQAEHLDEALALLNTIPEEKSESQEEVLLFKARLLRHLGQFDELQKLLDGAIAKFPNNVELYDLKGWMLVCKGKYDEGIQVLHQGLLKGTINRLFRDEGLAYLLSDRPNEASADFEHFWESEANDQAMYGVILQFLSLERAGKYQTAKEKLQQGLDHAPKQWPYPILLYLSGKLSEAKLVTSIRDRDEMTEAQAYIGLRLLLNRRGQDAMPHFEWVMKKGNVEFLEYEIVRQILQGKTALTK